MARRSLEAIAQAAIRTWPLDEALHHAANDYPGGVDVLAIEAKKSSASMRNNLDPGQPERRVTLEQFELICQRTQDRRILDALMMMFPGIAWFEMQDSGVEELELLKIFNELSKKASRAVDGLIVALEDGVIDDTEWPALEFDLRRLLGASHGLLYFGDAKRSKNYE